MRLIAFGALLEANVAVLWMPKSTQGPWRSKLGTLEKVMCDRSYFLTFLFHLFERGFFLLLMSNELLHLIESLGKGHP